MPGERRRGEEIRRFALKQAEEHPRDLVHVVAKQFHIGPQTARVHVQRLCSENLLTHQGKTRDRVYFLRTLEDWHKTYPLALGMSEHDALDADVWPRLGDLPDNVRSIWSTAFTEMLNNVLDHASATEAIVEIRKTAVNTEMVIHDNGVGIFKKIQQALQLTDERYAVVELSKGKFTTDPSKHSGEGIFFTSKMFDRFDILSGGLAFSGKPNIQPQWVTQKFHGGTTVWMKLDNDSTRQPKDVYDQFTEDFVFNKTAVPIKLAQVGPSGLVSRSQAKRVLAGIDRFKVAALDFTGVGWIGQGFADEIFRVYQNAHPDIRILVEGANPDVKAMIQRVKTGS
jgi:anti-sigma regulatory factor (Ser/Thr protein kinase)